MAYISVTNQFDGLIESGQMDTNFQDIVSGLSDGTKDIRTNKVNSVETVITTGTTTNLAATGSTSVASPNVYRKEFCFPTIPSYPFLKPEILDLTNTDVDLSSYKTSFTDGKYGYFIPNLYEKIGRVLLSDFSTVDVLDLFNPFYLLNDCKSSFTDGRYGYCVSDLGVITRFDLINFTDYSYINLPDVYPYATVFSGSYMIWPYAYICPETYATMYRIDLRTFSLDDIVEYSLGYTNNRFAFYNKKYAYITNTATNLMFVIDNESFTKVNTISMDDAINAYGCSDGRYGYMIDANGSLLYRFDMVNSSLTKLELTGYNANYTSFSGICHDGRYIYLSPDNSNDSGLAVRVDTHDFSTVTDCDFTTIDATAKGYHKGFCDGKHVYFTPFGAGGLVARTMIGRSV